MMRNLICPTCGAENQPGDNRCKECDAPLIDHHEETPTASDELNAGSFPYTPQDEQDLPDLLHALKQDGEIPGEGHVLDAREREKAEDLDLSDSDPSQGEEDVPDWLRRIRERARKEEDAAGEITQKLSAAQESLIRAESENQHGDFTSWIQSLKGELGEETSEYPPDDQEKTTAPRGSLETTPAWLSKIRKVKATTPGERRGGDADLKEKTGDSLLQWLVALEEGTETVQPIPDQPAGEPQTPPTKSQQAGTEIAEESGESTQKIPLAVPLKKNAPALDISREEQIQANLFSSMVVDEKTPRPIREPGQERAPWVVRLLASLLLISALSAALFGGLPGERFGNTPSSAYAEMLSAVEGLNEADSVLIVADYQAAFAEEVHWIARPILEKVLTPQMKISTIATQPSGVLLSRRLLAELPDHTDLAVSHLGYFPLEGFGAYAIADLPIGDDLWWRSLGSPSGELSGSFDGVFILSDSYEGARIWVEQLSVRLPDIPLYLLVTAQAEPLLAPYKESGQVASMVAGIMDVGLGEGYHHKEGIALDLRAAHQLGLLLLAAMLIIGAILGIKSTKDKMDRGEL
jgi:hypothetical protein